MSVRCSHEQGEVGQTFSSETKGMLLLHCIILCHHSFVCTSKLSLETGTYKNIIDVSE